MRITGQVLVLDAADIDAESAFWAALLSGTVTTRADWHSVIVNGAVAVGVQLAPGHQPPAWPDGQAQQVHLDFYVEDIGPAHDHATSAGAKLLQVGEGSNERGGFHVYADPAGHPFCLCWGPPPLGEVVARHLGAGPPEQVALAGAADVAGIVEFGRSVIVEHYAPLIGPEATRAQVEQWWQPQSIAEAVEAGLVVIATRGGEIVGVGQRGRIGAEHVIWKLYLHPDHRGHGLGSRLLQVMIDQLPAKAGRVWIEHFAANEGAGRFYEREGFIVDHVEASAADGGGTDQVWRVRRLVST